MAMGRRRMPMREATVSRGPRGVTVFLVFLLLSALAIGVGFTIGHYVLDTLGDRMSDADGTTPGGSGGNGGSGGSGGSGGTGGSGGSGGTGGGTVPAGGGSGSVTLATSPLTVYAVQVGAFGSQANADKVVTDLGSKGFPGYVFQPASGSSLYKVWAVTVTRKEVAQAAQASLKTKGYADCFVADQTLDATPLKLSGSSLDYLGRIKAGLEAIANCMRIEGDVWDKYHAGTLNRSDAAKTIDALITTVGGAKDGIDGMTAPQDLASLGQAVSGQLASVKTNLASLKNYLGNPTDAERLKAECSYIGLIDAYGRLGASLGSRP